MPFSALPDPRNPEQLLVDTFEIRNLPSASIVKAPRVDALKSIAVIADPVFSATDTRLASPATNGTAALPRLRFSLLEAEAILKLAPTAELFLDFDAKAELLHLDSIKGVDILHIATHGIVNSRYPELSHLAFSGTSPEGEALPGTLRLHEFYHLDLPIPLVVLSACESALGVSIQGEGLQGLTRGFLLAGARQVVASMWQVHDKASAAFMRHFYRAILHDGEPPATALHTAQRALRAETRWSAPTTGRPLVSTAHRRDSSKRLVETSCRSHLRPDLGPYQVRNAVSLNAAQSTAVETAQ